MSILRSFPGNRYTLGGMIHYVAQDNRTEGKLEIGFGVNPNYHYAIQEMYLLKQLYNKTEGRQYKQFMFSFDRDVSFDIDTLKEIAYRIGEYYANDYQLYMAAHFNTRNVHLQFVLNTVNVHTGQKFEQSPGDLREYKKYVNSILAEYNLNPIKIYIPEEDADKDAIGFDSIELLPLSS